MKLTKETLKRIIKEEIDHLMLEQQAEEAAEDAQEILNDPKAGEVMDKLEDNPEVSAALDKVVAQLQGTMKESYPGTPRRMGGLEDYERHMRDKEARDADDSGELAAGGAFVGAMAAPMVVSTVLKSAAGKALIAALAPAVGSTAAGIGLGLAATGGALAVPMAIAMVLAKLDAKKAAMDEAYRQSQPVQAMDFTPEQQRVIDHYAKLMKTRKQNQVNFYEMQSVIGRILKHKSFKGAGFGTDASSDYKLIQNALKSAGYTGRTYIF